MSKTIVVGIADYNTAKGSDVLVTYALGSCVGICLYDPTTKIAGLSHIMLPSITEFNNQRMTMQRGKYADTAIELLMQKMIREGALKIHLRAKIAGGAQMFPPINNKNIAGIGERNTIAVIKELVRLRIPITAEDIGKNHGRTQYLYAEDGRMIIKTVTKEKVVY